MKVLTLLVTRFCRELVTVLEFWIWENGRLDWFLWFDDVKGGVKVCTRPKGGVGVWTPLFGSISLSSVPFSLHSSKSRVTSGCAPLPAWSTLSWCTLVFLCLFRSELVWKPFEQRESNNGVALQCGYRDVSGDVWTLQTSSHTLYTDSGNPRNVPWECAL